MAPGVDHKGRPFKTCCRACAVGAGHDHTCGMKVQSDEELAVLLAARDHARLRSMRARRRRVVIRFHDAASCLWDPVWGGLELHEIDEATPEAYDKRKRKQVMIAYVFALFPSIVVGFSCCFRRCCLSEVKSGVDWSDVRRGWRRYFCSCAFLLAVPQVLFVVAPYFIEYDQTDYERYDEHGAKNAAKMIYEDEWWRLVTPILLHTGWSHVLGNIAIQMRAGITLEYLWGHAVWIIVYFGTGVFATLSSCALKPDSLSVGASGALCGIMGAWPVYLLITWDQVDEKDKKKRDLIMVVVLLSIGLLIGFSFLPLVDWAAHFGGLIMGVFIAMAVFARLMTCAWKKILVGLLGTVLTGLAYGAAVWYVLEVIEPAPSLLDI